VQALPARPGEYFQPGQVALKKAALKVDIQRDLILKVTKHGSIGIESVVVSDANEDDSAVGNILSLEGIGKFIGAAEVLKITAS
jgi:hypothetical protein